MELYETPDFSIQIPKGWTVTSGGTGMYHSIRIQDPAEPLNQMFVLLKADILLHSQEGKDAWTYYSGVTGMPDMQIFAQAPVLSSPSTENFYQIFPQYADFAAQYGPGYAGYTERFPSTGSLSAYALGDELLRATFTEDGREGEGMFAASVVDFGSVPIAAGPPVGYQLPQADGGYYMAYNIMAVTAAKDTFVEWEGILTESLGTLEYSENFVNATIQAGQEVVQQAMDFSRNANEVLNGIMSSWKERDTSVEIIPYVRRYVLLGIYDVLDGERVPYQKKEDTVVAKAEVYGNLSTFSISAEEQEMGTELKVTMLQSCVGLSEQGKERAMTAVMDRIVQYLENELLMNNRAAIIMPQEDKYG